MVSNRTPILLLALAFALAAPVAVASHSADHVAEPAANDSSRANETAPPANDTPTAPPAGPAKVTFTVLGKQEGGATFFEMDGKRNPTLTVPPGAEVTIIFKSETGAHNLNVNNQVKTKGGLLGPGGEDTITFTAPEKGSLEYWCDPHKTMGMKGKIQVASAGGGGEAPAADSIQGEVADLADLGYPDCAGHKVPMSTVNKEIGGPTLEDYVAKCRTGVQEEKVDPYASVDYVLPASFAALALGVAGVWWVHKRYEP